MGLKRAFSKLSSYINSIAELRDNVEQKVCELLYNVRLVSHSCFFFILLKIVLVSRSDLFLLTF